jgi:AbrB family looped-hinge helix DNA binding protein
MITTIDEAGRIVIPEDIRTRAGLRPGAPIEITFVRGCVEIAPAAAPTRLVDEGGVAVLYPEGADEVSAEAVRSVQDHVRGDG